jgi:hypothetical protein
VPSRRTERKKARNMAQLDLFIRNGIVVTAGDVVRCDIGVT